MKLLREGRTELLGEVIAHAKEGDRDALHFLYVRYADGVYACIERLVRDPHEAEDLTQTVFVKLIKVIGQYEDRGLPFAAWLHRVARNTALDYLRAYRSVPCEEVRSDEDGQDLLGQERLWSLREALEQLPPAQREVVALRYLEDFSIEEIAGITRRTRGAVRILLHRARSRLRKDLEGQDLEGQGLEGKELA